MKVESPFFPQPVPSNGGLARPNAEPVDARKAFAAMLSATVPRNSIPQAGANGASSMQERTQEAKPAPSAAAPASEPANPSLPMRPGRVIDIRV